MKLLFNFDEDGSDELKKLLGSMDGDFNIDNLRGDITSATDELIDIIGEDIYNHIYELYSEASEEDKDVELVYRTRRAVALNAYRLFAPDNDLGHTNSGRVQRLEENQKTPFEWQIDRSNKSLERKYYKAIDALLLFLDKNVDDWKKTQAYKDSHALFVRTTKDFNTYFDINNSRLLLIKLTPGIRQAENVEIKPRIGKELFLEIKEKLIAGDSVDNELLAKLKEACVLKAMAWGMQRLSAQLFPEGVLQYKGGDRLTTQAMVPTLKNEPATAAFYFERDASVVLRDIELMIEAAKKPVIQDIPKIEPRFDVRDNFIST